MYQKVANQELQKKLSSVSWEQNLSESLKSYPQ